jgi:hypothetical protein
VGTLLLHMRLINVNMRGFNRELASVRHCVACIHDQVEEHLLDFAPVYPETSWRRRTFNTASNVLSGKTRYHIFQLF